MFTDFGFKTVLNSNKHKLVQELFDGVSSRYDLMNDLMSFGVHRLWKKEFVSALKMPHCANVLDLAGGTGDIALSILKRYHHLRPNITVCDLTPAMMEEGSKKAINQGITKNIEWVCANGEILPFHDNTFDCITISFGLRNTTNKNNVLKESLRCLKPSGIFYCLEFSKPTCDVFKSVYDAYSFSIIPKIGKWVASDEEAYQYLVESIRQFPDQETLKEMMQESGFKNASYQNLSNGIVAIHKGLK